MMKIARSGPADPSLAARRAHAAQDHHRDDLQLVALRDVGTGASHARGEEQGGEARHEAGEHAHGHDDGVGLHARVAGGGDVVSHAVDLAAEARLVQEQPEDHGADARRR